MHGQQDNLYFQQPFLHQGVPYSAQPAPAPNAPESTLRHLLKRRGAKAIAGALATVLVTVFGVVITYMVAPSQEVAAHQAVEQFERDQDAQMAPVSVEDAGGPVVAGAPNLITDAVLDLDGVVLNPSPPEDSYGVAPLLPSAYPTGDVFFSGDIESGSSASVWFTLTGLQNKAVRIRDIRAVIEERQPAVKGTMVYFPPQGNVDNLKMGFDLDSDDLSARILDENEGITDEHYFRHNTVSLQRDEPLGFNTVARTVECACQFALEVEFSDGKIVRIDDNGRPFMLSPYRDDAERIYTPTAAQGGGFKLTRCPSMQACRKIAYE